MSESKLQPEEQSEEYKRFRRFLIALVAVPKSEIYELDPKLKPKPKKRVAAKRVKRK